MSVPRSLSASRKSGFSRALSSRKTQARSLIRCAPHSSLKSITSTREPSTTRGRNSAGCCKPCSGRKGPERGLDLYFERHDGQAVTVEDFISALGDANKTDLTEFLLWYNQAGTPGLDARMSTSQAAKSARLTLSQSYSTIPDGAKRKPVPIPVRLGLVGGNGEDLPLNENGKPLRDGLVMLRRKEEDLRVGSCRRASRALRSAQYLRAR